MTTLTDKDIKQIIQEVRSSDYSRSIYSIILDVTGEDLVLSNNLEAKHD